MAENITNADREDIARQLAEAAEVLKGTAKRVTAARSPMTEHEFGQRIWGAQGFQKPAPKPPRR